MPRQQLLALTASLALSACGGGGAGSEAAAPAPPTSGTQTYTVTVQVSGLAGTGLVLSLNASESLPISANGAATFATHLDTGKPYAVSVQQQPGTPAQTCTAAHAQGNVAAANITDVTVDCVAVDLRPLNPLIANAWPNAAAGVLMPYTVFDQQGIALESADWVTDRKPVGLPQLGTSPGMVSALQWWNTPGTYLVGATAHASNGRSAEAGMVVNVVDAPLVSGYDHSCALTAAGGVLCWGGGSLGPVAPVPGLAGVRGLAAGRAHDCALLGDHSVKCWGDNHAGQLGYAIAGVSPPSSATPVPANVQHVAAVAAGDRHTCALLDDQTVSCFGANDHLQLHIAMIDHSADPLPVAGLVGVQAIAAGGAGTCAIKADTTVSCWGGSPTWTGNAGSSPKTVETAAGTALKDVLVIKVGGSAAGWHACAIVNDGRYSVYCWGDNDHHQAGASNALALEFAAPVAGLSGAQQLSTMEAASCALVQADANASVQFKCWGANDHGQSSGTSTQGADLVAPTAVPWLQSSSAPDYTSGGHGFLCSLQTWLTCWGLNNAGQLGNHGTADSLQPVQVDEAGLKLWSITGN